jgi:hypothetical protein
MQDCTCKCRKTLSPDPIIACTHYHNHFEAKDQQLESKLEYCLDQLAQFTSIQTIKKEKEASEAKCSKLQKKLKQLRDIVNSLCNR